MGIQKVMMTFFQAYLPKPLANKADWKTLQALPKEHFTNQREKMVVDLLYQVKMNGNDTLLYILVEHQSSNDPLMALRVHQYTYRVIESHMRKNDTKKIPLIFPIVLYHGHERRTFTNDIRDLVDAPKALVDQFFLQPFQLIDLSTIKDDVLKKQAWAGIMLLALKHIFQRDATPHLRFMLTVYSGLKRKKDDQFIRFVLQYIMGRVPEKEKRRVNRVLREALPEEEKIHMISILDSYVNEGIQTGIQTGIQAGRQQTVATLASKMLSKGLSPSLVAEITGVSRDKLSHLQTEASTTV